jgi:ribosome recycling factor
MIQKIVKKQRLHERITTHDDLAYWLSRTPEERVATVDYLRTQYYGNATRLQRVARVVQRPPR